MRGASDAEVDPWSRVRVVTGSAGCIFLLRGLAAEPSWVEATFVEGWGLQVTTTLAWLTAPFSFSVAEPLIAGLVAAELWWLLDGVSEVAARRRGWMNALAGGVGHVAALATVGVLVFYATWGLSYARPPALARMGLEDVTRRRDPATQEWIASVAAISVDRTNAAYRALHGVDDAGAVTEPRTGSDIDGAIDAGFAAVGARLGLGPSFTASRGRAKVPVGSAVMSWLGIGGVFIPFTAEATVNGGPPAWSRVLTTAHEKAHQRMVASEDEATFFGILACAASDDPLLRYAAWEGISRQLLRAVAVADRSTAVQLHASLLPGVRRDQEAVSAWWQGYTGPMERVAEWMNDHYLRANKVEGGVQAYGRAGRLILAYAASPAWPRNLAALPPAPTAPTAPQAP
jgi:hypothetical protein